MDVGNRPRDLSTSGFHSAKKRVTPNFASFVGATSVRNCVLGFENRKPTPQELNQMKELVRVAMKEPAMGLGSSLIYAPADYASTEELIELSKMNGASSRQVKAKVFR